MKTEDIKNKLKCENVDMKKLSITELKHLKNQAKSLTDKRMKRKCKYKYYTKLIIIFIQNRFGALLLFKVYTHTHTLV